jgi:hypothetical protein
MTYKNEFPDMPDADMPVMPYGFYDSSWHNDACPSYANEMLGLRIWIDYVDPAKREIEQTGKRFILCSMPDYETEFETIETDSFAEIIAAIETATQDFQSRCHHQDTGRGICANCGKVL